MSNTALIEWVTKTLTSALEPTQIVIHDDSHLHVGHAGNHGGAHLRVEIDSAKFIGLSRVKQHQLVYQLLADEMGQGIHALALTTKSSHLQN